ncbi:MAG: hypothetical protein CUN52_14995, partial [Phototrophicales bacterium]
QNITLEYDILTRENDVLWKRTKTKRILRAYPLLALATLVKRCEFDIVSVLDTQLAPVDVANPKTPRAVFVLKRQ